MEYQVVVRGEATELAEAVSTLVSQGWSLQGGISVTGWIDRWENERKGYSESETTVLYAQAMIRVPNELGGH